MAPARAFVRLSPRYVPIVAGIRTIAKVEATVEEGQSALARQRLKRPISPHLSFYRMEQTWFVASIWTRITGHIFSGMMYAYTGAYLISPLLGWNVDSASVAMTLGALPATVKGTLKLLVAWPFMFHCVNGARHLLYDTGYGFTKTQIKRWGWFSWTSAFAIAVYVAFAW